MTNTLATMYAEGTAGITGFVDGIIAIGVGITVALAGWALLSKALPRKRKVA